MRIDLDRNDALYSRGDISDSDNQADSQIAKLRDEAAEYREDDVGTQDWKGRLFSRANCLSALLGIALGIESLGGMVLAILFAARPNDHPPDDGLTPDQRAVLVEAVERWRNLDDAAVWQAMAEYTDSWNPSWQAQILMMDTIKKLARPRPWMWRDDDAVRYVQKLVDAYGSFTVPPPGRNRARALYVTVSPMTYDLMEDGKLVSLPRQVAADLVELAITEIVRRSPSRMRENRSGEKEAT